jgi:hypothetical protein
MRRALLVAVVALVAAPAARAETGAEVAALQRALPIARAAWPDNPCIGHEAITWMSHPVIDAPSGPGSVPGWAPDEPHEVGGYAIATTCTIVLNTEAFDVADHLDKNGPPAIYYQAAMRDAHNLCLALAHEEGHLAGRGHSTIPGDIMNPLDESYAPCDKASVDPSLTLAREAEREARYDILKKLHRVRCHVHSPTRMWCVGYTRHERRIPIRGSWFRLYGQPVIRANFAASVGVWP